MRRGRWRLRIARWLAPETLAELEAAAAHAPADTSDPGAWAEMCELFAWRLLVLSEQLRPALDSLEGSEEDPDRLAGLYQIDHGITRMRRVARDLRVLSGRGGEEVAGHTTSLLDVIRMAASAIEHYDRLSISTVAELAVVPYAADDVACLLAALADNATRYSPSEVTISAHLLADGDVMLRVEDIGLGIDQRWLAALNTALDGPVPASGTQGGRHTGFAVVHYLARRHGLRVQLARRQAPGPGAGTMSGTIAMVVIPAALLCEIPARLPATATGHAEERLVAAAASVRTSPGTAQGWPVAADPQALGLPGGPSDSALPRRTPGSVRVPARQARAAPDRSAAPDPAADGFAFAADLEAFSAGLGSGRMPSTEPGESRPGAAEGHIP